MKINVLLVSKLEKSLKSMRNMILEDGELTVSESSGGPEALTKIENLSPDIIIMPYGSGDSDTIDLAERITLHKPRCHVILLMEHMELETVKKALNAGLHNITEFPSSPKDFTEYVKTVFNSERARLNSLSGGHNLTWMSRVVTVFGSKGGVGKTTIATNLAVKLAEKRKKVALLDLDLQFGDVNIFLDIEPKDTISDLVQEVQNPNIDIVRSYMVVHSSGVHVLCAPKSPEYAELVTAERIQGLISLLRSYYDYVIIDTPPMFSDITVTTIESSTTVLFVTGLDISILKNSKISMTILESLQQKDKVKLIVNRAVEVSSITINDVQRIIGCPIWAKITSDYMIAVSALNRGIPFVTGAPNSKLSQSITSVAEVLASGSDDFDIQKTKKAEKKRIELKPMPFLRKRINRQTGGV